jgi:hypothetical protein
MAPILKGTAVSRESKQFLVSSILKVVAAAIAALVLALVVAPLTAQAVVGGKDAAFSFRTSTLGFGLEAGKQVNERFSVRLGANWFGHGFDEVKEDVDYVGRLRLQSESLIGDYYPAQNSFHLSLGIALNNSTIKADGVAEKDGYFTINGHRYTNEQVGTLHGDATFPSVSPYLGLGWGRPTSLGSKWQLLADVGVLFSKATLTLSAANSGVTPGLAEDLRAEQADSQRDINRYLAVYPVVSFGLAYRF